MQRDAENRVREMQSRARLIGGNESVPPVSPSICAPKINNAAAPKNAFSDILSGIDSEKLVIIALLWILWNEKADPKLLLALLYLLL